MSTASGIAVPLLSWTTNNNLNLLIELVNKLLRSFQDQMDTFLIGNSTDECKQWYTVIELTK